MHRPIVPPRPRLLAASLACAVALACPVRAHAGAADSTRTLPPARIRAWQCGLLRDDRLRHASLSCALAAGGGLVTRRPVAAAGATIAIGVFKECVDARRTRFDPVDLAADVLGAAVGASVARAGGR